MKFLLLIAFTIPALGQAKAFLPSLKQEEQVCYVRVYTKAHLQKYHNQKFTAAAITFGRKEGKVFTEIYLKSRLGHNLFNGGNIANLTNDRAIASMDGQGEKYQIEQDLKDKNKILVRVEKLILDEMDNFLFEHADSDGVPYERMIFNKSHKLVLVLEKSEKLPGNNLNCEGEMERVIAEQEKRVSI